MLDRVALKQEAKGIVKNARVSAYLFTLLALAIGLLLYAISTCIGSEPEAEVQTTLQFYGVSYMTFRPLIVVPVAVSTFIGIAVNFLNSVLSCGSDLYHLGVRRGQEMPYGTLFDGFTFAGKIILLSIVMSLFIFLWSLLFVIPGIIAGYRYRFAFLNLCENPEIGVMEALRMSKSQTNGFKWQLFVLDLSFLGWGILCALTAGILSIWIAPYIAQTNIGYFLQCKAATGVGSFPTPRGEDSHPWEL